MASLDDIKTSKGAEGEQLLQQAKRAKGELTTLRAQFSAIFGPPKRR